MKNFKGYSFEFDYEFDHWDMNFSADEHFLKWQCPLCHHKHPSIQYDLYEYFDQFSDFAELEIQCENCEEEFKLQIEGRTHWEGHTFKLKKIKEQAEKP